MLFEFALKARVSRARRMVMLVMRRPEIVATPDSDFACGKGVHNPTCHAPLHSGFHDDLQSAQEK
jgi:hypothetical protein